ncbi:MAG: lysylphosphatidylglycerol synthase transmembrane domain-containing protein [Candidatus Aenigmatarchaeota archaeon]
MKKLDIALFSLSFLLLALLLSNSNPSKVFSTLLEVDALFIAASVATITIIIAVKLTRWKIILDSIGIKRPLKTLLGPYLASLFLSNITPARVGEPSRSYYLKKATGDSFSLSIATVVLERIMDLSVMALFSLVGIYFLSAFLPGEVSITIGVVISIIIIALLLSSNKKILSWFIIRVCAILKKIPRIKNAPLINRLEKGMEHFLSNFHKGFVLATREKNILIPLLMTAAAWVLEAGVVYFSFLSIGIHVPFYIALSVFSLSLLVGLMTFLPGNIGSFEASAVILLMRSQNLGVAEAMAGIMIYRLCTLWFVLIVSGKFFLDQR